MLVLVVASCPPHPMFSGSLPVQPAPLHFTPAGRSGLTAADVEGVFGALAAFLPSPPPVKYTAAAITTSAPTTPARNIVSRRLRRAAASGPDPPTGAPDPPAPTDPAAPTEPPGPD